jgi:hypothetical protein
VHPSGYQYIHLPWAFQLPVAFTGQLLWFVSSSGSRFVRQAASLSVNVSKNTLIIKYKRLFHLIYNKQDSYVKFNVFSLTK